MDDKTDYILELIKENAGDIMLFAEKAGGADVFGTDRILRKAIFMSIINIVNLAKKLPDEFKKSHSDIPWEQIDGIRNITAQGYHTMDDDVIWDIVKNVIPWMEEL